MSENSNLVLDVVLASDETYAKYAAICIQSLIKTNSNYYIRLHLLDNGLSLQSIEIIRSILSPNNSLHTYSLNDIAKRIGMEISMDAIPISITTYARLFITSVLPKDILKVLYVDCDVIFNGDIGNFYFSDLENNLVGGVLDTCASNRSKSEIGLSNIEPYINCGVLLIALDQWRKEDIEKKFLELIYKMKGNIYHHDQGVINAVCIGRKKIFHPRYNASSYFFSHPYKLLKKYNTPFYTQQECKEATSYPTIIHFTCGIVNRPWVKNCKHPLAYIYKEYKQMTPYKDILLEEDKFTFIEKFDSWMLRKTPYVLYEIYSAIRKAQYKVRKSIYK